MTVKDLRAFLRTLSSDVEIIVSQDPEGNGYSHVDYDVGKHKLKSGKTAIVLYPVDRGVLPEELFDLN
tara:strand:+ start:96 stop:299 length:204 start_codon:yes stop_codon:yes gene_type:complete